MASWRDAPQVGEPRARAGRRLRAASEQLNRELDAYRLVLRHPRTPRLSKILLGAVIGCAILPFDLIPDLPPVGHLDDLVVLPAASLNPFGHLIRWEFQSKLSANWQLTALRHAEEHGQRHEQTELEKDKLDRLFPASWVVACPICDDFESAVCELDVGAFESREVIPRRMACANCGFVVLDSQPFLSQILVGLQLAEARESILKDYAIE